MNKIRIGTRGSRLAVKQAELVREAVCRAAFGLETELVVLRTKGDKILDRALSEIGEKGVFVSEFEQALLEDSIDVAVHSAKDLPTRPADGLKIAAVLPRADVRDVLVVKKGGEVPPKLRQTKKGTGASGDGAEKGGARKPFVLGTGSRRRQMQARMLWENVSCELIRGNVETRLEKLEEGGYDGILLAKAGLDRLEIGSDTERRFDFHTLAAKEFLPAACQGIIAVEAKEGSEYEELFLRISDGEAQLSFWVEQEVLIRLEAGCSEAVAAWCRRQGDRLLLDVMYEKKRVSLSCRAEREAGLKLAKEAAELVKSRKDGSRI